MGIAMQVKIGWPSTLPTLLTAVCNVYHANLRSGRVHGCHMGLDMVAAVYNIRLNPSREAGSCMDQYFAMGHVCMQENKFDVMSISAFPSLCQREGMVTQAVAMANNGN